MKMNQRKVPDRILRDLCRMAEEHDIREIILFGSRARGDHRERSDIDLAVRGGDYDGFYWDVQENVHSLLSFDIVDLDGRISGELKEEIEKDGIRLYEKI